MKAFTDLFSKLDGSLAFAICAVVVAAVFIYSLIVMLTKRAYLPLGRIVALAALSSGICCYFLTLCTEDAAYAAGNAVIIISTGSLLGLISAVVSTFTRLPSNEDGASETKKDQPMDEADEKPASETTVLPLEELMYKSAAISELPEIELPHSAAPEMDFDAVVALAGEAEQNGIALEDAKALVRQISKLKLLPENAPDFRRLALAEAQEKIVSAVKKNRS